jgi:hypothetical protein
MKRAMRRFQVGSSLGQSINLTSSFQCLDAHATMPLRFLPIQNRRSLLFAVLISLTALTGCAQMSLVGSAAIPPIPAGKARLWFYRVYLPSETLNMTQVSMNGVYAGYAPLGGAFYRDVQPGVYHITVESYGRDFNQSTNVGLVVGQEAFVQIESLRSWASIYGIGFGAGRDTFYARLIFPWIARAEIAQSIFYGGG